MAYYEESSGQPRLSPSNDSNDSMMSVSDHGVVLEKDDRVILRMEISHPNHEFIMGPGGANMQKLREDSSCMIYFPGRENGGSVIGESGRGSVPHLHKNEVSLRGKLPNVIMGCQKLRSLIPFQFQFSISMDLFQQKPLMAHHEYVKSLENIFEIKVMVESLGKEIRISVAGSQNGRTILGAEKVMAHFAGEKKDMKVFHTFCVHPHSQSGMLMQPKCEQYLQNIAQITGTCTKYPDPKTTHGDRETMSIEGPTIRGVAAAWILFMSLLPISVRFFITEDMDYSRSEDYVKKHLSVNLLAPRKEATVSTTRQYIELRTFEDNIHNIAIAYESIVGHSTSGFSSQRIINCVDRLVELGLSYAVRACSWNPTAVAMASQMISQEQQMQMMQQMFMPHAAMPMMFSPHAAMHSFFAGMNPYMMRSMTPFPGYPFPTAIPVPVPCVPQPNPPNANQNGQRPKWMMNGGCSQTEGTSGHKNNCLSCQPSTTRTNRQPSPDSSSSSRNGKWSAVTDFSSATRQRNRNGCTDRSRRRPDQPDFELRPEDQFVNGNRGYSNQKMSRNGEFSHWSGMVGTSNERNNEPWRTHEPTSDQFFREDIGSHWEGLDDDFEADTIQMDDNTDWGMWSPPNGMMKDQKAVVLPIDPNFDIGFWEQK